MHSTWTTNDFALAMRSAIESNSRQNLIKYGNSKLIFNGFWRNGDKQNVCLWTDKATWHDAKTGEGGGCKEFAKIAFNLSLKEFMDRFWQNTQQTKELNSHKQISNSLRRDQSSTIETDKLWSLIEKNDLLIPDLATQWLHEVRGFSSPRSTIGSGFANLTRHNEIFFHQHIHFVRRRQNIGPHLLVPIRSVNSHKVQNIFFRAISNVAKEEKSRLLTGAGGWNDQDGSPRAFGFPNLTFDFPNLVMCEGMADYFAAEYLLYGDEKFLPLGVPSASALPKWAQWLKSIRYQGRVIWIYQLNVNSNGIHASGIGQQNATRASKILREGGLRSELFRWHEFLRRIPKLVRIPNDLADVYSIVKDNQHELSKIFLSLYSASRP